MQILTEQKRSIYIITFAPQILHDMNTKVKGYFLGAIAAATYGTNPLFALPLYKDGMDPDSVLFFRYLFAIPILGMMIKGRGRSFKIEHKAAVPLIVMGLLVAFFFISFVPKLQLYGSRDCFYTSFRLSDHGRIDYGTCIQRETNLTNSRELAQAQRAGYRCAVAFVIQMEGITEVRPNVGTQPEFGTALAEAKAAGVRVLFLLCRVGRDSLEIVEQREG